MMIQQLFLLSLFSFLLSCSDPVCPFYPLECKSTQQRTQESSDFSGKLLLALKKLPVGPKVDIEVAEKLAVDLSSVLDEYRYQPIDTILASSYNYQIGKICGLYNYINGLPDGKDKLEHQELLSHAIKQLFDFVDDYASGRQAIPLSDYSVEGGKPISGCSMCDTYEVRIDSFLQDKINNDRERRSTWIKMKEAIPQYLSDCKSNSNSTSCLEDLWQELIRLDASS